jgi:NAD-dependent deacetylase
MSETEELKHIVNSSQKIVFFGGAGVSTESGIPDFRSVDGLYNQSYDYPPEMILSRSFFETQPFEFFRFYKDRVVFPEAKPNAAHLKLAQWEQEGKLSAVVTQNIDGLHQAAGSKKVWELHGSVLRNHCTNCQKKFDLAYVVDSDPIPLCDVCGKLVEPEVVLYEDPLDTDVMDGAIKALRTADTLIIGGTSLVVYPAAGLVNYFQGKHLVVINLDGSGSRLSNALVIKEPIGKVFSTLP